MDDKRETDEEWRARMRAEELAWRAEQEASDRRWRLFLFFVFIPMMGVVGALLELFIVLVVEK